MWLLVYCGTFFILWKDLKSVLDYVNSHFSYVRFSVLLQQYESTVKITYPSVIQLVLRFLNLPCLSYLHLRF